MYNSVGTLATSTGAATLAMTGPNDTMPLVTGGAFVLMAVGGMLFLIGSRLSKKKINAEVR